MTRAAITRHGRDHRPGGHDPIPGMGARGVWTDILADCSVIPGGISLTGSLAYQFIMDSDPVALVITWLRLFADGTGAGGGHFSFAIPNLPGSSFSFRPEAVQLLGISIPVGTTNVQQSSWIDADGKLRNVSTDPSIDGVTFPNAGDLLFSGGGALPILPF